jgi:hypothetical protein
MIRSLTMKYARTVRWWRWMAWACAAALAACGGSTATVDGGNPDGASGDGGGGGDGGGTVTPIRGTWRMVSSGTTDDIYSVWGSGPTDVWAAAARTQLHTTDGRSWTGTPSMYALRGVGGSGANDVWFTGLTIPPNGSAETGRPVFLHKTTGATFAEQMPAGLTTQVYAVWARAPNDAWVVGAGPALHWNGTAWSAAAGGVAASDTLYGVFGFGERDVWAAGQHVYRWNGTAWTAQTLPGVTMMEYSFGVWGASATDVWLVGAHIYAQRWTGAAWAKADTHLDATLNAVWGASATDVWAVGDGGTIQHWNGRDWETGRAPAGATQPLRAIWGASDSDIWAAGERGTLLHYTVP